MAGDAHFQFKKGISMRIFGAGMAGLLAAHMLRRYKPIIFERAESLPNNHNALLRFRSDAVSRATGIPFKKVKVQKLMWAGGAYHTHVPFVFNNLYSAKVTGEVLSRSIMNLEPVDRFIAPLDFITQLAASCDIEYGCSLTKEIINSNISPLISTIPMNFLMDMVGWKDKPLFNARKIITITGTICNGVDVYQTIYYPEPEYPWYRVSITGDKMIVEMLADDFDTVGEDTPRMVLDSIANQFGIRGAMITDVDISKQEFGKITPIPANARKQFILAMTDMYSVYSVGRFATWRQMLLDDVVHDVEIVDSFINQRDAYKSRLALI